MRRAVATVAASLFGNTLADGALAASTVWLIPNRVTHEVRCKKTTRDKTDSPYVAAKVRWSSVDHEGVASPAVTGFAARYHGNTICAKIESAQPTIQAMSWLNGGLTVNVNAVGGRGRSRSVSDGQIRHVCKCIVGVGNCVPIDGSCVGGGMNR